MKRRSTTLVCIAALASVPAHADIRVLLRFDATGHHVHRVINIAAPKSFRPDSEDASNGSRRSIATAPAPLSAIAGGRSSDHGENLRRPETSVKPVREGFARLSWFDDSGLLISQTSVPDPRVTHSPSHIVGDVAARVGLNDGAWLATGPDAAKTLSIRLGSNFRLGLGPEQWKVLLPSPE